MSVLMVRWLLRKGTTRSHSELGRETLLRQWYFSLSCGRVGHCRTFYTLVSLTLLITLLLLYPPCPHSFVGVPFYPLSLYPSSLLFFTEKYPLVGTVTELDRTNEEYTAETININGKERPVYNSEGKTYCQV